MPDFPSYAAFAEQLYSTFTAHTAGGEICLTLVQAKELSRGGRPAEFPTPMSLLFTADTDAILGSGTYALEHPSLGRLHLFVTPVVSGRPSPDYEILIS